MTAQPYTLVIFDTETTGINYINDRIVQFACIAIDSRNPDDIFEFESLCNPEKPIPIEASTKHNIYDYQVAGKPLTAQLVPEIFKELLAFAEGTQLILGGHNTRFDWRFLGQLVDIPKETLSICTLRMARAMIPSTASHTLEYLYRDYFKLSSPRTVTAHDALCDVWMSYEILHALIGLQDGLSVEAVAKELQNPIELEIFPFGTNKGTPFKQMPKRSLKWYIDKGDDMDPDVLHTCKLHYNRDH